MTFDPDLLRTLHEAATDYSQPIGIRNATHRGLRNYLVNALPDILALADASAGTEALLADVQAENERLRGVARDLYDRHAYQCGCVGCVAYRRLAGRALLAGDGGER